MPRARKHPVLIFDLDQTILYQIRGKCVVSKKLLQTWQELKQRLRCKIVLVSSSKYAVDRVRNVQHSIDFMYRSLEKRNDMLQHILDKYPKSQNVHYFDKDRTNVKNSAFRFPQLRTHHIASPYVLSQRVRDVICLAKTQKDRVTHLAVLEHVLGFLQHDWKLSLLLCNKTLSRQIPNHAVLRLGGEEKTQAVIVKHKHIELLGSNQTLLWPILLPSLHTVRTLTVSFEDVNIVSEIVLPNLESIHLTLCTGSRPPSLVGCVNLQFAIIECKSFGKVAKVLSATDFFPPNLQTLSLRGDFRVDSFPPKLTDLHWNHYGIIDAEANAIDAEADAAADSNALDTIASSLNKLSLGLTAVLNQDLSKFHKLKTISCNGDLDAAKLPPNLEECRCYWLQNPSQLPRSLRTLQFGESPEFTQDMLATLTHLTTWNFPEEHTQTSVTLPPSLRVLHIHCKDLPYLIGLAPQVETVVVHDVYNEWKVEIFARTIHELLEKLRPRKRVQVQFKHKLSLRVLYGVSKLSKQRLLTFSKTSITMPPAVLQQQHRRVARRIRTVHPWDEEWIEELDEKQSDIATLRDDIVVSLLLPEAQQEDQDPMMVWMRKPTTTLPAPFHIVDKMVLHGSKVVVPASLQFAVIERVHTSQKTHKSQKQTLQEIKAYFWWSTLQKDVCRYVRDCEVCGPNQALYVRVRKERRSRMVMFHFECVLSHFGANWSMTRCTFDCSNCSEKVKFDLDGPKPPVNQFLYGLCYSCKNTHRVKNWKLDTALCHKTHQIFPRSY